MPEMTLSAADRVRCSACGATTEWGPCRGRRSNGNPCGARGFFTDGSAVECRLCGSVYTSCACSSCGAPLPVGDFLSLGNSARGLARSVLVILVLLLVLGACAGLASM